MRFLANENFPRPSIEMIRSAGFYVESVTETNAGITDHQVIHYALQHNLVILTFDKDYGEIIFKERIPLAPSVVFFRNKGLHPGFAGEMICSILSKNKVQLEDRFTVIEETGVRQRIYQRG